MNISALNALAYGTGATPPGQNAPSPANRQRESTANATQAAAPPQDARPQRPDTRPDTRPVLDLSDTALTRRDIPRGSIVDIVA